MENKMRLSVFVCVLLLMGAFAQEIVPVIHLELRDEASALTNQGTGKLKPKFIRPENIEWVEGRSLGSTAIKFKELQDRKAKRVSSCITLPAEGRNAIDFTKPFTATIWVKPDKIINNDGRYFIFSTFSGDKGSGLYISYAWGRMRAAYGDGKKELEVAQSGGKIENGTWNHVAVVYDGSKISLYVNGLLSAFKDGNVKPPSASAWSIGAFLNGYSGQFFGCMEDFRLYGQPLSAQDIFQMSKQ